MTAHIFGIRNCDTMKKAFLWLETNGIPFEFHDYRKSGIDAATLERWCAQAGWQALVNTRGTTWRKLSPEEQAITSETDAIALMCLHTSLIRRPVIDTGAGELLIGFDPTKFAERFACAARGRT